MLRWRFILGTLFIAALILICWLDFIDTPAGKFLQPLAVVAGIFGAMELREMFRKRGGEPIAWVCILGICVCIAIASEPRWQDRAAGRDAFGQLAWLAIGLAAAFLIAVLGHLLRFGKPTQPAPADSNTNAEPPAPPASTPATATPVTANATTNLALSCFTILYLGGLIGFMVQLRIIGVSKGDPHASLGMLALISLIATVKMSDTGQYFAGRLFGRHKLAPRVSPGKTWEGLVGGFVFAIATAWFVFTWVGPRIAGSAAPKPSIAVILLFAVSVAVAGLIGDLAESMLKRDAGVKDSSTWMPGFGGVLDLLDSLLGAAPVAYIIWVATIL
jgi:phosphatidate cytidylyltransferase